MTVIRLGIKSSTLHCNTACLHYEIMRCEKLNLGVNYYKFFDFLAKNRAEAKKRLKKVCHVIFLL